MKNKLSVIVFGAIVCWFLLGVYDEYSEKNIMWHMNGTVVDHSTGKALPNVQLAVKCREAFTSKYRESSTQVPSTNFVILVNPDGHFSFDVFGGSVFLKFNCVGYGEVYWERDSSKGQSSNITNLQIRLHEGGVKKTVPSQ